MYNTTRPSAPTRQDSTKNHPLMEENTNSSSDTHEDKNKNNKFASFPPTPFDRNAPSRQTMPAYHGNTSVTETVPFGSSIQTDNNSNIVNNFAVNKKKDRSFMSKLFFKKNTESRDHPEDGMKAYISSRSINSVNNEPSKSSKNKKPYVSPSNMPLYVYVDFICEEFGKIIAPCVIDELLHIIKSKKVPAYTPSPLKIDPSMPNKWDITLYIKEIAIYIYNQISSQRIDVLKTSDLVNYGIDYGVKKIPSEVASVKHNNYEILLIPSNLKITPICMFKLYMFYLEKYERIEKCVTVSRTDDPNIHQHTIGIENKIIYAIINNQNLNSEYSYKNIVTDSPDETLNKYTNHFLLYDKDTQEYYSHSIVDGSLSKRESIFKVPINAVIFSASLERHGISDPVLNAINPKFRIHKSVFGKYTFEFDKIGDELKRAFDMIVAEIAHEHRKRQWAMLI